MKKLGIVLILSILLVSCSKSEPIGRYQAIEIEGDLIIMDITNGEGEIWRYSSSDKWEYETSLNKFKNNYGYD